MSMRIRIQLFITMRTRIQVAKRKRILADPDPGQNFKLKKLNFYMKNIQVKNIPTKGKKPFFERQESRLICKLWSVSMFLDPDPHSQCPDPG